MLFIENEPEVTVHFQRNDRTTLSEQREASASRLKVL